jgi:hypothetical protein
MGMRMPETCWAVFKRQVINWRSCCILLVDSVKKTIVFLLQTIVLWLTPGLPGPESGSSALPLNVSNYLPVGAVETFQNNWMFNNIAQRTSNLANFRCRYTYGAVGMSTHFRLSPRLERSWVKADSHIACRAHAVPLPYRAAKGLECVFPIWFTQSGSVWFTLAMPRPCHALTMPFFSRLRHSTAVERRPVGYLPAFGFFRQRRGVPRRLLSEAYQTPSQRSIPTTAKSGISTLQKRRSVKLLD